MLPKALAGRAAHPTPPTQGTLADLHNVTPDVKEAETKESVDQAMQQYRKFLEESPETPMTPEAIRRLADLELEKQYGIHSGDGKPKPMPAPESAKVSASTPARTPNKAAAAGAGHGESDQEFERRTTAANKMPASGDTSASLTETPGAEAAPKGPLEAIALYKKLLTEYPSYKDSDQVLYQMARAYDELGRTDEAMETMERAISANPNSVHFDEVQFRRGEYFFTRRKFRDAENAYAAITKLGARSSYYELALYKLGWTFYKQELYEEAVQNYMALLDYKVSTGYNFDEKHEKEDERRVATITSFGRSASASAPSVVLSRGPAVLLQHQESIMRRPHLQQLLANNYLAKLRYAMMRPRRHTTPSVALHLLCTMLPHVSAIAGSGDFHQGRDSPSSRS